MKNICTLGGGAEHTEQCKIGYAVYVKCPVCMQNELALLEEENKRMRKVLTTCFAILRHKEIRPPMQEGVQQRMEDEIAELLEHPCQST